MIPFLELRYVTERHAEDIRQAVLRVIASGRYLDGPEVERFENDYAAWIGSRHAVGVGSGLDALTLILRAYIELGVLRRGDEVVVPANAFIGPVVAVVANSLVPILVEPDPDTYQIDDRLIEDALTPRTRAVIVVHLYGRCAYTQRLAALCRRYSLVMIEDNAHAHGCMWGGRRTGSLGSAAAHSFNPDRNLGALGNAGAVTTDDDDVARLVRSLSNYGSRGRYVAHHVGCNSRLDELQAAILGIKLRHVEEDNRRRRAIAHHYTEGIHNPRVVLPSDSAEEEGNVFHIFPVRCSERELLQRHLAERGIETLIHYPIPPHLQACFSAFHSLSLPIAELLSTEELSLPISPSLTPREAREVVDAINVF